MENEGLANLRAKKLAFIIGIAFILGFSIVMFTPQVYTGGLASAGIVLYLVSLPVGILEAYILGRIVYLMFKLLIRKKVIRIAVSIILIIVVYLLGIFSEAGIFITLGKLSRPYVSGSVSKNLNSYPNEYK